REAAQDILDQAERAGEIVRNLLDFSHTEKAKFSPLAPDVVVKSSLALLKNQIMISGLTMNVDVPPGLDKVAGSLRHLQQVFLNLLLNAVQATPAGGRIDVSGRDASDFVCFIVRDTGKGISQEDMQHIFEPFFTTKEVGKGTGLGLAVTYSIVKRHGGRIEVESEPGEGTAFYVYLPKAPKPAPGIEEGDEEAAR
ncbi:MAG: sensor histidine kinase, partial [Acidobacteriota bacterium]